jgi:hypothetical protein
MNVKTAIIAANKFAQITARSPTTRFRVVRCGENPQHLGGGPF